MLTMFLSITCRRQGKVVLTKKRYQSIEYNVGDIKEQDKNTIEPIIEDVPKNDKKKSSKDGIKIINVSRANGLGELDADQLKVAAFNKNTRRLVKINIEDAIQADKITSLLMGQKVEGRKTLITKKAKEANLDF